MVQSDFLLLFLPTWVEQQLLCCWFSKDYNLTCWFSNWPSKYYAGNYIGLNSVRWSWDGSRACWSIHCSVLQKTYPSRWNIAFRESPLFSRARHLALSCFCNSPQQTNIVVCVFSGHNRGRWGMGYSVGCSLQPHCFTPLNPTHWTFFLDHFFLIITIRRRVSGD